MGMQPIFNILLPSISFLMTLSKSVLLKCLHDYGTQNETLQLKIEKKSNLKMHDGNHWIDVPEFDGQTSFLSNRILDKIY